jgi:ABC-type phosphate transport system permease subunit
VTMLESPRRPARASTRRDRIGRVVLAVVALVLAFLLGVAFARTLDERPKSSGTETIVRTLTPLPQDAPGRTVTVTVTATNP